MTATTALGHTAYREFLGQLALAAQDAVKTLNVRQLREPLTEAEQKRLFAHLIEREGRGTSRQNLIFLRKALVEARVERAGMDEREAKLIDTRRASDGSAPLIKSARGPQFVLRLTPEESDFLESHGYDAPSKAALFKVELHRQMRRAGFKPRKPRAYRQQREES